jgi:hypothetical protein
MMIWNIVSMPFSAYNLLLPKLKSRQMDYERQPFKAPDRSSLLSPQPSVARSLKRLETRFLMQNFLYRPVKRYRTLKLREPTRLGERARFPRHAVLVAWRFAAPFAATKRMCLAHEMHSSPKSAPQA